MKNINENLSLSGEYGEVLEILLDGETAGYVETMFSNAFDDEPRLEDVIDDEPMYIEQIFIDESYRNKGIGTQVLEFLAKDLWCGVCLAPDTEDSQRLYERLGGVETREYDVDQGYGVYILDL